MVRLIGFTFALALLCLATNICATLHNCSPLPEYLDRPINDSITFINLLLDETHYQIQDKNQRSIVTLQSMNRCIDQGGHIEASINVGRYVYRRFLSDAGRRSKLMSTEVLDYMQKALQGVQIILSDILAPCDVARVRSSIEKLLQRIKPALLKLRHSNEQRQLDLYEEVSNMLYTLHATEWRNEQEYSDEFEVIVEYGTSYSVRFDNEIALQEEYYLKGVADEMRQIVRHALDTREDL